MADILVVDDEIGIRELLNEILGDEGHTVLLAENAAQARQVRDEQELDLVLLDIWMPEVDGVSLLKEWASIGQLSMPVIMMSGHATIDTAVEATRIGALDFLEKPISLQKLLKTVENGLARRAISRGVPRPLSTAVGAKASSPRCRQARSQGWESGPLLLKPAQRPETCCLMAKTPGRQIDSRYPPSKPRQD